MKNRRLHPRLFDASYLVLSGLRKAIATSAAEITGRVVDYGAGDQPYRSLFLQTDSYDGADFPGIGNNQIILTSEYELSVSDEVADAVVSFQVLEHVRRPELYLKECFRVVKPDGTLLLSTHGQWPYHPDPDHQCGDYWRWTEEGLECLIEDAGFRDVQISRVCPGIESMVQTMLAMRDPFRHQQKVLGKRLKQVFNMIMNVFCILARPCMKKTNNSMDILPVVYLVRARRG